MGESLSEQEEMETPSDLEEKLAFVPPFPLPLRPLVETIKSLCMSAHEGNEECETECLLLVFCVGLPRFSLLLFFYFSLARFLLPPVETGKQHHPPPPLLQDRLLLHHL
jgi:hypothetical protein